MASVSAAAMCKLAGLVGAAKAEGVEPVQRNNHDEATEEVLDPGSDVEWMYGPPLDRGHVAEAVKQLWRGE